MDGVEKENRKVSVWVHLENKEPFGFVGLWDSWQNAESGDGLNAFTIITTEANALVRAHTQPNAGDFTMPRWGR